MRCNPRYLYFEGPYDEEEDEHAWVNGGIVGLTSKQWLDILDFASSPHSNRTRRDRQIVRQVIAWINAGPKPFDKTKPGLYRSRGDEVVLLMDSPIWHIIQLADSGVDDTLRVSGDTGYSLRDAPKRILTPAQYHTKQIIDFIKTLRTERYDSYLFKPVHMLTVNEIDMRIRKRYDKVVTAHTAQELLKSLTARREGREYIPAPSPSRVPLPRPVYKPHPNRPDYNLPSAKVRLGDKIRVGFTRAPEFVYYRRKHIREVIRHYSAWSQDNGGGKIRDGHKDQIRQIIDCIDNCYEIEVAGLKPVGHHYTLGVFNQCFISGGSGYSGMHYAAALLFRAEQTLSGKVNQVSVIMHESPNDSLLSRFVMDQID